MLCLIIGGSGSGKSAYAEQRLSACEGEKYYIATMKHTDAQMEEKIKRHRKMREGKGFTTIEQPSQLNQIVQNLSCHACVLIECMSNLTANEMFEGEQLPPAKEVAEKIVTDINILKDSVKDLIIVTNNVFEDGILYDLATMEYIKALGMINVALAQSADVVVEVVAGIPVVQKNEPVVQKEELCQS